MASPGGARAPRTALESDAAEGTNRGAFADFVDLWRPLDRR